jgi:hypothetical protein
MSLEVYLPIMDSPIYPEFQVGDDPVLGQIGQELNNHIVSADKYFLSQCAPPRLGVQPHRKVL